MRFPGLFDTNFSKKKAKKQKQNKTKQITQKTNKQTKKQTQKWEDRKQNSGKHWSQGISGKIMPHIIAHVAMLFFVVTLVVTSQESNACSASPVCLYDTHVCRGPSSCYHVNVKDADMEKVLLSSDVTTKVLVKWALYFWFCIWYIMLYY